MNSNSYADQFTLPLTGQAKMSSLGKATPLQGSYIPQAYETSMANSKKDLNTFSLKEQETK